MYKLNITNEDINIDIEDIDKYIKYIEKLTNIHWRIIPNYEDYIISEYGNVINIKSKKIINLYLDKHGYQMNLYKNNICKHFRIHRLVYNIFIKPIDIKDKIYFKDGNKSNCHYTNLSLKFTLPKNLIDSNSLLRNNNYNNNDIISKIPKPIKYKNLKKIIDKYKFVSIKDFIKNLQKDTKLEWKIIPDYEKYIISEYGDIINLKFKNILKSFFDKNKYYRISLSKNNIYKNFFVHRLVFYVFIDNEDIEDFDVHHKDGNKLNNHYSNLEKIDHSKHTKYHCNQESEKYLNQYKKYYDSKYKENLSIEEISKKYNIPKNSIHIGIQQYKIYLFNNEDINKYNSFNIKEKQDFYSNVILKEDKRRYLEKAEEIYNRKIKENLTYKELAKIYNLSEYSIRSMNKDHEVFTFLLNKDFDKFNNSTYKEKEILRKKMMIIKRNNNILDIGKKIKDLKLSRLSTKDIAKKLNLSKNKIYYIYKKYKKFINDKEIKDELKSIKNIL